MTAKLVTIGDVLICLATHNSPYGGVSLCGPPRREALRQFRDGILPPDLVAWYAPFSGGARRITASEVDWESAGVLS